MLAITFYQQLQELYFADAFNSKAGYTLSILKTFCIFLILITIVYQKKLYFTVTVLFFIYNVKLPIIFPEQPLQQYTTCYQLFIILLVQAKTITLSPSVTKVEPTLFYE